MNTNYLLAVVFWEFKNLGLQFPRGAETQVSLAFLSFRTLA